MKTNIHTLQNQFVVIVGGSSGIGLAVGILAAAEGAKVTLISRSAEKLAAASKVIPEAKILVADLNDASSLAEPFHSIGKIDHVYVTAGTARLANILEGDLDAQFIAIQERIFGSARVVRAVAPLLSVGGSITLTGGVSTDRPVQGAWATSVATAAAEQMARSLALELAPLRVNAVSPGWTDTPMWDAVLGENKLGVFASVAEKFPIKRLATAEEVGLAVLLLMKVGSITGEVIHVDCGSRLV